MSDNTEKNVLQDENKASLNNEPSFSSTAVSKKKNKKFFSGTKKIIALVLAIIIIISSVFLIRFLNAPPKYEEISQRFEELIEQSYDVNVILFGEGLPTYERVYDPQDSVEVFVTGETIERDGKTYDRNISYYYTLLLEGDTRDVVAFREFYKDDYSYVYISHTEQTVEQLTALFPAIEGVSPKAGLSFYQEMFRSDDGKDICYLVPYKELEYDFYYNSADEENYDYVDLDASSCKSVDEIKALASTVYSKSYLESIYGPMFDGIANAGVVSYARYTESNYKKHLAMNNAEEPNFTERRAYDFSTAEILWWKSNKSSVKISVESYLPSNPDKRVETKINLVLQDGVWYLDNPTY